MTRLLFGCLGLILAPFVWITVSFIAGAINPALGGLVCVGMPLVAFGLWLLNRRSVRDQAARMARRMSRRGAPLAIALAILAGALGFGVSHVAAQAPQPPETVQAQDEKGRNVVLVKGFDLKEWGGTTDPQCKRTELDAVELREEVGSANEPCVIVLEWSLKNGDQTITSGFYSFLPREWLRLNFAQSHDRVRFVGTMWYIPQGWNAHMLAADLAGDWQVKNPGLKTIVGLSPTDPWVLSQWSDAEGKFDAPAPAATPVPTSVAPAATPAPTPVPAAPPVLQPPAVNPIILLIQNMVIMWNDFWTWVF